MRACILAIGSEMLTPFRVDTNSLFITERLNAIGYDIRLKAVVGDDVDELAEVLRAAGVWADLIVITGGLGPTEDDVTRDAVARVYDMGVAGVNGIVLTKLDGTAKGGVAVAIAHDLKIPIRYVGVGEGIDDLVPFSAEEYVDGLFEVKW